MPYYTALIMIRKTFEIITEGKTTIVEIRAYKNWTIFKIIIQGIT